MILMPALMLSVVVAVVIVAIVPAVVAVAAAAVIVRVAMQLVTDMGDPLTQRSRFPRRIGPVECALGRVDVAVKVARLVGGKTALASKIVRLVPNLLELLLQL